MLKQNDASLVFNAATDNQLTYLNLQRSAPYTL